MHSISTTRLNGFSKGAYSSNNLALHVNDEPHHVDQNRQRLMKLGNLPAEPHWLTQTHSNIIVDCNDMRSGELNYINAGHDSPFVLRAGGEVERIKKTHGIILGVRKEATFEPGVITIKSGDGIYMFTDGVTEAMNVEKELFGETRLEETLKQHKTESSRGILDSVESSINEFVAEADQHDDITMLMIKINK